MGDGTAATAGIGLAAYGFFYNCGFVAAGTPHARPQPFDGYSLIDLATKHGLHGVEFPPAWGLGSLERPALEQARAALQQRGLWVVLDSGVVDVAEMRTLLEAAAVIGAKTVRATVSTLLCGDRRAVRDSWPGYLKETAGKLRQLRGVAEELGVAIALENHQDMNSGELVALCEELGSPQIGVTLDTINPLAVGEEPLTFARRILPYLKHVHLKDYWLYATPEGYRLVRCPVGSGVLDLQATLALCAEGAPDARVAIEIGALEARHIRLLEDDFWPGYPPRQVEEVLPVLRLRERAARPAGEAWRTPWERGEYGDALAAYELAQFEQSVQNLRGIHALA